MLQLINVKKDYYVGEQVIPALKGVSIDFREHEFVSILGQSGCGKTTLMNIIGGLDRLTDGDIYIDGTSTKEYKSNDWDDYRNQKIGFVFQSYNLISHLSVLTNVELALTISGINGEERVERSKRALDRVGLSGQYNKKPNQLSGGQMQRVAIARAIVNEPDILLADEPTGAIDSETSIQIMDILKEISNEKLVIMVTHNRELAEQYSTRIVEILDGNIISDNNPISKDIQEETKEFSEPTETIEDTTENDQTSTLNIENEDVKSDFVEETQTKPISSDKKKHKKKGATMSLWTSIKLSFKNLINKRGRSILTAIAGSIGIISIAIILAVNNGFNNYIDAFEKQSMSKYPITVSSGEYSVISMFEDFLGGDSLDGDSLNLSSILDVFTGDASEREAYTKEELVYIYGQFTGMFQAMKDKMAKTNDISKFKKYLEANFDDSLGVIKYDYSINMNIFKANKSGNYKQISPLGDNDSIKILLESMANEDDDGSQMASIQGLLNTFAFWDEIVADDDTILSQYDVLSGHLPTNKNEIVIILDQYNQITDFDLFMLNELGFTDLIAAMGNQSTLDKYIKTFEEALAYEFYIMPTSKMYAYNSYTGTYLNIKEANSQAQLNNVVTTDGLKVTVSGIIRPKKDVSGCLDGVIGYHSSLGDYIIDDANNCDLVQQQTAQYNDYVAKMQAALEVNAYFEEHPELSKKTDMTAEQKQIVAAAAMAKLQNLTTATKEDLAVTDFASLMTKLNVRDLDKPSYIYIYPSSINNKDEISAFIENFNVKQQEEELAAEQQAKDNGEDAPTVTSIVEYEDNLDSIVNELNSLVNTITIILIAVALVSVLVTMLLIAIVMYISVQDRTREIGILRSLGARKIDISNIFNVETALLGLAAGIIGVVLALILQYPVNLIFAATLNIQGLMQIAWWHAPVLIVGAIIITLISGLIPASIASKKDPVIALRTE